MLTEQRKRFVKEYMALKCKNMRQAAINAGYSEKSAQQQASNLMKDNEVLAYLQACKDDMDRELREAFVFEAKEAFRVMCNILKDPKTKPRERITVAKDFLDRAGYKPVDKTELTGKDGGALQLAIGWEEQGEED